MSEHGNGNGKKKPDWVSNKDLETKLTAFRWEVRFLILAGMVASQVLPAADIAKAAGRLFP